MTSPFKFATYNAISQKIRKIFVSISMNELVAMISNASKFDRSAGLADELFKNRLDGNPKFHFTKGITESVDQGLYSSLSNSSKYPNKTGNEYRSLKLCLGTIRYEYERQLGQ